MMARAIGLVQLKGGAGRSTIATNLAGELARFHDVLLLDCDMPQGTSASWAALRKQAGRGTRLTFDTVYDAAELAEKIERRADQTGYVILDGAPRLTELSRAILSCSDLCLVPVGASAAELWATSHLFGMIAEVNEVRPVVACLVWTRFRAHTQIARKLSEAADAALSIPALKSRLGYRVAYTEALGRGLTAAELGDRDARLEIVGLVAEIRRLMRYDLRMG
jgi:chromosome partitioning protein